MNRSDKRKALLRYYHKFANKELPEIVPPHIRSQKRTLKMMTERRKKKITFRG